MNYGDTHFKLSIDPSNFSYSISVIIRADAASACASTNPDNTYNPSTQITNIDKKGVIPTVFFKYNTPNINISDNKNE